VSARSVFGLGIRDFGAVVAALPILAWAPGGGAPQFVFCTQTSQSATDVGLSCSGADACPLGPCQPDEWLFIADVTLPLSPFGGSPALAQTLAVPALTTPITPVESIADAAPRACRACPVPTRVA
jgi:hypothetical protein